jgi:undecaprenyl-phosphate 4-deoxy-4-formamido-L-arabinose transferase
MQGLVLRTVAPAKIASVPIQHFDREYGTSNYSLKKLISLWSNIAGFSIVPLRISRRVGAFLSLLGVLGIVWLVVRKIMKSTQILGWTSTMMTIIFFSGIIIMTLGIVGEYVGRSFLTIGNYPQFVVRNVYKKNKDL